MTVEIVDAPRNPTDKAAVVAEMARILASERSGLEAARCRAQAGLTQIAQAIRRHPGAGQTSRLVRFLGGLYDGTSYPFDLTDLRALDRPLADACLTVLDYDRYGGAEIHEWGVIDARELNGWLTHGGHYYDAQRRRIGRELYQEKFGPNSHTDEGLDG